MAITFAGTSPKAIVNGISPPSRSFSTPSLRFNSDFEEFAGVGRGGFGTVVRVKNRLDGQEYAIKKIKLSKTNGSLNSKMLREVATLSRLTHTHVVRYYQAWIEDGEQSTEENSETESDNSRSFETRSNSEGNENITSSRGGDSSADWDPAWPGYSFQLEELRVLASNKCTDKDIEKTKKPNLNHTTPVCHFCTIHYHDWEVSFKDWKLLPVCLQPINICQLCYTNQLRSAGVDPSQFFFRLKPVPAKMVQFLYIQMEYCQFSLRDILEDRSIWKNYTEDGIWKLFRQIVEGLAYIHASNTIHRDLKPDNIFFGRGRGNSYDVIKIGDFGLATSLSTDSSEININAHSKQRATSPRENASGNKTGRVGTFLYCSPEMFCARSYDEKVDIYALGIILFELWKPFHTGMERARVIENLRKHNCFPDDFNINSNREVQVRMIKWCLQRDPQLRPSALDLLQSLSVAPVSMTCNIENERLVAMLKGMEQQQCKSLDSKQQLKLQKQLADCRNVIVALQERNARQEREIEELKKQLALVASPPKS